MDPLLSFFIFVAVLWGSLEFIALCDNSFKLFNTYQFVRNPWDYFSRTISDTFGNLEFLLFQILLFFVKLMRRKKVCDFSPDNLENTVLKC